MVHHKDGERSDAEWPRRGRWRVEQTLCPLNDYGRCRRRFDRTRLEQDGRGRHGGHGCWESRSDALLRVVLPGAAGIGRALFDAVRVACAPAARLTLITRGFPPLAGRMTHAAGEQQRENGRDDP